MRLGVWAPIPQWVGGTVKWGDRYGARPRAIVWHRMEGSLEGSDSYLRREFADYYPHPRLNASTHFGIGKWFGTPQIRTWVDTAYSAFGWASSPTDIPDATARKVFGDVLVGKPTWPYYRSTTDLNRFVIAIEVEGFARDQWDPDIIPLAKQLHNALVDRYGPLWNVTHTCASTKPCPGMASFIAALPGYYGNRLGLTLPDTATENELYDWLKRAKTQKPKVMYIPRGVPVFREPGGRAYATSPGTKVTLTHELRSEGLWAFPSTNGGMGLVRKSQAGSIGPPLW